MKINHNISAQLANVNLKKTNNRLSSSLESLSSGYKINKAADDSAGLAISNKMRTQIRALDQASRNADDGQSIIQTAEGALSEIESLLQRMRQLSVQAANDTYTIDDREAAQQEIDKLSDEVDRIASTTEFNGNGLLDGSCTRVVTFSKQGLNSLANSDKVEAGVYKLTVNQIAAPAAATLSYKAGSSIQINGTTVNFAATDTDADMKSKIQNVCDMLDIDVTGGAGVVNLKTRATGQNRAITIIDENGEHTTKGVDAQVTLDTTTSKFATGAFATSDGTNITIEDGMGFKMELAVEDTAAGAYEITVYDTGSMMLQIGANEHQTLAVDFQEVSCRTLQIRESDGTSLVNVCSQAGASNAITTFDNAVRSVSALRSNLGAYENRLEKTVSSLDVSSENMTDSMSRIIDTDMASAMTNYTQENVLVQAATSMLAQANNRPQQVLSLLQS